jgi:hypothetical protein
MVAAGDSPEQTTPHDCSGGAAGSGCTPEGRPATVLLLTDGAARLSGLNLTHLGAGRHSAITSSRVLPRSRIYGFGVGMAVGGVSLL